MIVKCVIGARCAPYQYSGRRVRTAHRNVRATP
jgi:hypothetical protein